MVVLIFCLLIDLLTLGAVLGFGLPTLKGRAGQLHQIAHCVKLILSRVVRVIIINVSVTFAILVGGLFP